MARPFAYNPSGTPPPGCTQIGDVAIGVSNLDYSTKPGSLQWWNGPDENPGYVIAKPIPTMNQPNPLGLSAGVGFNRSTSKTDESFLSLIKVVFGQNFMTASSAKDWLNQNGYWTSWSGLVEQGLILQLDAYENSSYPGTGSSVYNLVDTNTHTHTLIDSSFITLNGIKCFDCTTGNKRVEAVTPGPTLSTTGYTYITWVRLNTNNSSFRTLLYTNSPRYTPITIPDGTDTLGYWDSAFRSSGYDLSSSEDVWTQFAIVGDDSSQTFYINDSQVGATISYGSGGIKHWGWGNNYTIPQAFGHVANLYLYDRKLSLSEITQQYNFLSPRFVENFVTTNLILHLDPSDVNSYSGSGTTINDLTSNNLDGSMSNISFTSPYFTYNGSNSQISISDNSILEPGSGDWTIEVWFRITSNQSAVILGKFDNGGGSEDVSYSIRMNAGGNLFAQIGNGTPTGFVNSTSYQTTTNTWYQAVYIWSNVSTNSFQTFINGSSIGTVSHTLSSILNSSNNLYIGSYNNGEYSQYFNGRIGIVRIYNRALSSTEVLNNFNASRSKYGL